MNNYENLKLDKEVSIKNDANNVSSGCGCSTESCCSPSDTSQKLDNENIYSKDTEIGSENITVVIDGQSIELNPADKNIVDVASRSKIGISAPCYLAKRKNGCCNACVVEIDGEQKFACSTTPKDGMNITVNRKDLKSLRKQRLLKYQEGIKSGNQVCCSSS